ncbi:hypothetical protein E4T44_09220 [Aureobasidium sp. EXF-8845]|nr:hypothetical protein E4T44_09220 [Aureobasidium sp. EXF-8845]KAI4842293.1 hypothetical protein E4T45_09132 [Aureobasidium sp. EXF-8846]
MCEKGILIWTCGCTHLQDPRPCSKGRFRNKACEGYAFTWVYRTPIPVHASLRCPSCIRLDEATALRKANEALLAESYAYSTLKSVATGDDSHRVRTGRSRFSRTASGTQILKVPETSTSEMNRLPSNANEYSAFLAGKFDPLTKLPDTHLPSPRPSRASSFTQHTKQDMGARDMPVVMQRSRSHAPPQGWQGPVVLGEDDYPYVEFRGLGAAVYWYIATAERCRYCAAFSGAIAAVEGFSATTEDNAFGMMRRSEEISWAGWLGELCDVYG